MQKTHILIVGNSHPSIESVDALKFILSQLSQYLQPSQILLAHEHITERTLPETLKRVLEVSENDYKTFLKQPLDKIREKIYEGVKYIKQFEQALEKTERVFREDANMVLELQKESDLKGLSFQKLKEVVIQRIINKMVVDVDDSEINELLNFIATDITIAGCKKHGIKCVSLDKYVAEFEGMEDLSRKLEKAEPQRMRNMSESLAKEIEKKQKENGDKNLSVVIYVGANHTANLESEILRRFGQNLTTQTIVLVGNDRAKDEKLDLKGYQMRISEGLRQFTQVTRIPGAVDRLAEIEYAPIIAVPIKIGESSKEALVDCEVKLSSVVKETLEAVDATYHAISPKMEKLLEILKDKESDHAEVIQTIINSMSVAELTEKLMPDNGTILHAASFCGNIAMIDCLMISEAAGFLINSLDSNKNTPLHIAAKEGNGEAVDLLLLNGADPRVTNKDLETPASLAMPQNQEIAQRIIEKKAFVMIQNEPSSSLAQPYLSSDRRHERNLQSRT